MGMNPPFLCISLFFKHGGIPIAADSHQKKKEFFFPVATLTHLSVSDGFTVAEELGVMY